MTEYLLAGSALLACCAAGVAGVQGVQMVRYRAEGNNVLLAVAAAVIACVGAVLFVLTLRSPAAFFTALRHGSSGIALYLYATLVFALACVVVVVLAQRSEDHSVPRWMGIGMLVVSLLLVLGVTFGFLKSALTKVDLRFWAVAALFLGLAVCLGAFGQLVVGVVRGNDDARVLGRPLSLVGAVLLVVGTVVFVGWLLGAAGAGAARTAFSFSGYTANMGSATGAAAGADRLAELFAAHGFFAWGGAVACGLVAPLVCGVAGMLARPTQGEATESHRGVRLVWSAVGLACALVGGYCLCAAVGLLL